MTERVPEKRRIRVWPAVVVLLVLVLIGLALPIYEGKRHQQIGKELTLNGCSVDYSHFESVPISGSVPGPSGPFTGTSYRDQSTLPGFIDKTGLSLYVRRVRRVLINDPHEVEIALPLVRQLGKLDDLSFYSSGVTAAQLESLLQDVHVKTLSISESKLPHKNLPWLNQDGMTALNVSRTHFSNPAIDDLPDSLEWLNATRTRINDDGLASFIRLKNLKELRLLRTPTSRTAIADLKKEMPWCEIKWQPLKNP